MLLIIDSYTINIQRKPRTLSFKYACWKSLDGKFLTASAFLRYFQMQVESNNTNTLHDRARLFSRIPPCIDLSAVTNCASETEKRWKSSGNQNGSNFNKPLHVKTSNIIENAVVVKMGPDALPIGKFDLFLCTPSTTSQLFKHIFRSPRLDSAGSQAVDFEFGQGRRS